jgi:hypothetical protein
MKMMLGVCYVFFVCKIHGLLCRASYAVVPLALAVVLLIVFDPPSSVAYVLQLG